MGIEFIYYCVVAIGCYTVLGLYIDLMDLDVYEDWFRWDRVMLWPIYAVIYCVRLCISEEK